MNDAKVSEKGLSAEERARRCLSGSGVTPFAMKVRIVEAINAAVEEAKRPEIIPATNNDPPRLKYFEEFIEEYPENVDGSVDIKMALKEAGFDREHALILNTTSYYDVDDDYRIHYGTFRLMERRRA